MDIPSSRESSVYPCTPPPSPGTPPSGFLTALPRFDPFGLEMLQDYYIDGVKFGPPFFRPIIERCMEFEFDSQDILIAAYPKSGITWMQEIAWQMFHRDDEEGALAPLDDRIPHLEISLPGRRPNIERLQNRSPPRIIITHLPYKFLHNIDRCRPRVIVVMRNPKDVATSYFHFANKTRYASTATKDFDTFFETFKSGDIRFGSWLDHVTGWWKNKDRGNFHFMTYEKLHSNFHEEISKMANFLGKDISDDVIDKIQEMSDFEVMRERPLLRYSGTDASATSDDLADTYLRKGSVGDWKQTLSDEQSAHFDEIRETHLEPVGLFLTEEPAEK